MSSKTAAGPNRTADAPGSLTHPDRVLWPDVGVTKQGLAEFYAEIWPMDRCRTWSTGRWRWCAAPAASTRSCFFQKHAWAGIGEHDRPRRAIPRAARSCSRIDDVEGLLALAQASVLEIHIWGATLDAIEKPDRHDLRPRPRRGGRLADMVAAALEVRERLKSSASTASSRRPAARACMCRAAQAPRRLGRGEGLRPPARRVHGQGQSRALRGDRLEGGAPARIFVDYLRNGRGATAVAAYSARARAGRAVSTPLAWDELGPEMRPDRFSVREPAAPSGPRRRPLERHAQDGPPPADLTARVQARLARLPPPRSEIGNLSRYQRVEEDTARIGNEGRRQDGSGKGKGETKSQHRTLRGFASMEQGKQREIARKGGANVPNEKRSFAQDRNLAAEAGRKGGRAVKPQHRSFAQNRALAAAAGRKGGQTSQSRRIGGQGDSAGHGEHDSRPSGGTDGDTNNG